MRKVLIANRGEIAVRIVRACRDYGLASVAVYADPDAEAPFVAMADEAYALRGRRPAETYLDGAKLIAIAGRAGADAIHPGYGFLSERADFARAVIAAGLTWIGPPPEAIDALGDKVAARRIARSVGAPLVAGSDGPVSGAAEIVDFARRHGLPVAIKAALGGGGRGLKVARTLDEIPDGFEAATREALEAFGHGACFVERFLERPRHVEAQVLADRHGTVRVVGLRDCSLQRRSQKLVEEAPAPFLTEAQRTRIHAAAEAICAAAGYRGAGTVEFLLGADGAITFLEVNTRLQVEHPVTEETTGLDLVVAQFRIAEGLALDLPREPEPRGHAIEFRINAEDSGRGFLPMPGTITRFDPPAGPGIRVDSGVVAGSTVSGLYDSLIAKLVVTGRNRAEALARARRALREFRIEGVATVLPFHRAVVEAADFVGEAGFNVHTRWIETEFTALPEPEPRPDRPRDGTVLRGFVEIDGRRSELAVPRDFLAGLGLGAAAHAAPAPVTSASSPEAAESLAAPVSGILLMWRVGEGDAVAEGDVVAIMEAMKMETPVQAHRSGTIRLMAEPGTAQEAGVTIARIVD